jgi:homoserine acetyltransferase
MMRPVRRALGVSVSSVQPIDRANRHAGTVQEGVLALPQPFGLLHGGSLPDARLAWRLEGEASRPVVVAMGGISAHRRVFDADQPRDGWWHEVVGPGLALASSASITWEAAANRHGRSHMRPR